MILVFGAGGFIGTYLVDELVRQGFEVTASDVDPIAEEYYNKKNVPFARIDITEEKWEELALRLKNITTVVNVACLQPVNVSSATYREENYINVNVLGTLRILDFCRRHGSVEKYIYTVSHRGVQGIWERGETITESSTKELKYNGSYAMFAISECAAQDCVKYYEQTYGLRSIVLRLPPVYGYGPHLYGYVNGKPVKSGFLTFIENAKNNEPLELWGDPNRSRDIIYVKDVVSAILLSIRSKDARGLYNIASGTKVSLLEEASAIRTVFNTATPHGVQLFTYRTDLPNDIESFVYDIAKARKDLQWYPMFSIIDMMRDIKKEMESERFNFLIEKRAKLLLQDNY